jgi:hypothetical protein
MKRPDPLKQYTLLFIVLAILALLAACGSSSSSGVDTPQAPNTPATPNNETLVDTLNSLGVNTDLSPRLDDQGLEYPDSYAPLGTVVAMREISDATEPDGFRIQIGRAEELFLGGFRPDARPGVLTVIDDLSSGTETNGFTVSDSLFEKTAVDVPWVVERNTGGTSASGPRVVQGTRRDATAGDFNGDGFRETAVVYFVEYTDGSSEVRLLVTDARAPVPVEIDVAIPVSAIFLPVNDLRIASGDFDGDQTDELALAISRVPDSGQPDTPVGIYIIDDAASGFSLLREHNLALGATLAAPYITLVVKAASLNHDVTSELVLVVNENTEGPSYPGSFASHYFVLENLEAGLNLLTSGPIEADLGGVVHTAVVASVATGDLDGDSLDELVFAGLEEVVGNCASPDTSVDGLKHLLVGLGNKSNDFDKIGASASAFRIPSCNDAGTFLLRFTHVNLLDFDGDGDLDIQVNALVFDGFPAGDWTAGPLGQIPDSSVILGDQEQGLWFDRSNSAMAVSDQTGDGIADIVTLFLDQNLPYLRVWNCNFDPNTGLCLVSEATKVALWPEDMYAFASVNIDTSHVNPMIVAVDVDNDNVRMVKYTNQHILDFTEPIVLAVLAAPPCEQGIGQNTDACTTTWGSASSATAERTYNVTVSGSVSFGSGASGLGGSVEFNNTLSFAAGLEWSKSYELTRSLSFTTGPSEDSVVFVTVPIDRFTYETIASTDPAALGETYTIDLPRNLIQLIATRDYYNASIQPDAMHIDDRVFSHVPGRISSYPTEGGKDLILATEKTRLDEARYTLFDPTLSYFDPVDALGGLEVGPISVGEGSGATELALEYVETQGLANSLELAYEHSFSAAFGGKVGWSLGISVGRTLSISHGDSTTYSGTIGSIEKTLFPDNRYSFGLFTYLKALDGQEFEVVNYWVEKN